MTRFDPSIVKDISSKLFLSLVYGKWVMRALVFGKAFSERLIDDIVVDK